MLVGTKLDLVSSNPSIRKVPKAKAQKFADDEGLLFQETSAVADSGVTKAFESLLQDIYDKNA